MHERRETSLTTGSSKSSPAGKGQGTNVKEESDCAVLPMKLANKATEQEPEAAENIRQNGTPPAQDGKGVSQALSGVRKVAR